LEGSSFSGLLTRVEIGHMRIKSAENGCIASRGSGSSRLCPESFAFSGSVLLDR
jgi:hypothetical protein